MRLWTIHPKYLDGKGLGGCWREALLAQKILKNKRRYAVSGYMPAKFVDGKGYVAQRGYWKHPELKRFEEHKTPVAAIASFLYGIYLESERRGYRYDSSKISPEINCDCRIPVLPAQISEEFEHLQSKLEIRDKEQHLKNKSGKVELHSLFSSRYKTLEEVTQSLFFCKNYECKILPSVCKTRKELADNVKARRKYGRFAFEKCLGCKGV